MKMADDEMKMTDDEMKMADDEMKMVDDEMKIADDEMKMADDEMKMADDEIKMLRCRLRLTFTCLKALVKAPRYATTPDEMRTSPVRLVYCLPSSTAAWLHLSFSPPRPPITCSSP